MTPSASSFVSANTFAALTQRPVHDDVLERWGPSSTGHISLAQAAEVFVVVPATANSIAKLAAGMSDDMVGSVALAATCPMIVAPAMEHHMWRHPATVANVQTLRDRGVTIVGPASGHLASGEVGDGRLVPRETLVGAIRVALGRSGPLAGKRVLVSAGGTREPLDPIRFLGNRSSGRMGLALAEAALDLGANVDLVTTVASHAELHGADVALVETADDMEAAIQARIHGAAALVMCAAVADYRPASRSHGQAQALGVGSDLRPRPRREPRHPEVGRLPWHPPHRFRRRDERPGRARSRQARRQAS
jgi:phosphopantothenoylcysteine decarboxylase/phosphopantothenate--cysteine ligase